MSNDAPPIEPMVTEASRNDGCLVMSVLAIAALVVLVAIAWLIVEAAVRVGTWIGGMAS